MCAGQRDLSDTLPRLQETRLGIVDGELINSRVASNKQVCSIATLNDQLARFWSIEETPIGKQKPSCSLQERQAENFFLRTVKRNDSGRYIVRLPKDESVKLGESESIAVRRSLAIEKKLISNHKKIITDLFEITKHWGICS